MPIPSPVSSARAYEGQRQPDRAIECYRRCFQLDSTDFVPRIYLARLLEANHCPEDALHEFEVAYLASNELEPLKGVVRLNLALGRGDRAVAASKMLLARDTTNVDVALSVAMSYQMADEPERAIEAFLIVKHDSTNVNAFVRIGLYALRYLLRSRSAGLCRPRRGN